MVHIVQLSKDWLRKIAWLSLVLLLGIGVLASLRGPALTDINLYTQQAAAWMTGRLDVPTAFEDVAVYQGRYFVPFPPFPSVLLAPLVAIGLSDPLASRMAAVVLVLLIVLTLTRLARDLGNTRAESTWVVTAFVLGSGLWMCVAWSPGVWFFAHLTAFAAMALAVREAYGKARGLWLAFFLGLAFLSRQMSIYSALFFAVSTWEAHRAQGKKAQRIQLGLFISIFFGSIAIYLAYNFVRFGSAFESGYGLIPLTEHLEARVARYGLFHLAYVPFNFMHMFLQGPEILFDGPRMLHPGGMSGYGTSLTFASPFVFLALLANPQRRLTIATWFSVAAALTHILLYYNNGWVQVQTQRFSLDFLPLLFPLVVLGARQLTGILPRALFAWSIAWNAFALALLPILSRVLSKI